MFKIGFSEILIILLVIVIFVRPKDLPKFIRKAGQMYRHVKEFSRSVVDGIKKYEEEIVKPLNISDTLTYKTDSETKKNDENNDSVSRKV
jgi:Tat protein translocase TatB subunit